MKQPNFPHRSPTTPSATGYLERLSKALPGAKSRGGSKSSRDFWPDGAKLVISISLQFEAGAQPEFESISPFPDIDSKYPDLPAEQCTTTALRREFHACSTSSREDECSSLRTWSERWSIEIRNSRERSCNGDTKQRRAVRPRHLNTP